MTEDDIVALGFLTRRDLDVLGATFTRHIPVPHDDLFAELLNKLDQVEASPLGKGVVLQFPGKERSALKKPEANDP